MPGIHFILLSLLFLQFSTMGDQFLEDATLDLDADLADVLLGQYAIALLVNAYHTCRSQSFQIDEDPLAASPEGFGNASD